jgi:hypothetical protein
LKKHIKYLLIFFIFFLQGCMPSLQSIQQGFDDVDAVWESENRNLKKSLLLKTFNSTKKEAFNALTMTFTELGMTIESADFETGIIYASAQAPLPLSPQEWSRVKKIEEPRLKSIFSKSLGGTFGNLVELNPNDRQIRFNTFVLERKKDIQIQINFSMIYTGANDGLVYGKAVPTKAVELAGKKFWDIFERSLLIQNKTLN